MNAGSSAPPRRSEVSIEISEGSIKQFATGDHHKIDSEARFWVQAPENLSNQSFSPISSNGVPQLS